MRRPPKLVGILLPLVLAVASCGGDSSEDTPGAYCPRLAGKLGSCGLSAWTEGKGFSCREPAEDAERCTQECLLRRTCEQLLAIWCHGDTAWLEQCRADCTPTFACESGDSIPLGDRCDGYDHCADGSDEKDCDTFSCDNGAKFPTGFQCDGPAQCPDGSDEASCAGRTQCTNGNSVADSRVCDGYDDCSDGSDEAGCDNYLDCGDGTRVPPQQLCDGTPDCPGGADEPTDCGTTLPDACNQLGG